MKMLNEVTRDIIFQFYEFSFRMYTLDLHCHSLDLNIRGTNTSVIKTLVNTKKLRSQDTLPVSDILRMYRRKIM